MVGNGPHHFVLFVLSELQDAANRAAITAFGDSLAYCQASVANHASKWWAMGYIICIFVYMLSEHGSSEQQQLC